ncbi:MULTISPECIES: bile acid:sodium symporter family protein [unclassified Rhizobium]|uniref:bile acid:sodium symporter family protein n=1 Tax=unclassified Rhizobium TaxID=2613769 RepID=UPI0007EB9E08|nr:MULTISPECIES: bile acid:sodium symporter family protein [unclassified Rhizobium]ANM12247.1 sodium bile acid cotransporter protein [Rhizobium sp. N324]ANM18650.1 sodium bile acid cotransporter protein [Rhizobium sp. N541]ANM25036.1 sodium bile acid cotransporter protein [Rhizobium sp. N941]OYD05767.1 sodium bile acid cotransporter protein [Rhizobium sp. N4311]
MRRLLPDTFTTLLVCTVILASLLPASGAFAGYFGIATDLAIALLFFLHGARLSRDVVIAGLLHWRLHLAILLTTFGIFPLLGLGLGFIPDTILPQPLYLGILFLCVLPSTVQSSIAFTSMAGGNVPAAICSASASNIFGMFLTPLLVGLLFSVGGHGGFSFDALQQILLQLLAPFIVGQILQPWIGDWIRAKKKILMPVDRGSILMVVYLAFSTAVVEGLWHTFSLADIAVVIVADMLLLGIVLVLTMFGSRWLGFGKADEITITFCGSKKSLASGVPMANVIFAGQSIGAIVLPLMLFHQIQLMVCAVIAQKYAATAARRATKKEIDEAASPA